MKKITKIILVSLLFIIFSCEEPVSDYYIIVNDGGSGDGEEVINTNIFLSTPGNLSRITDTDFTLDWQMNRNARSYHLMVDDDLSFLSPIVDIDNLTENSYTISDDDGFDIDKIYYWKVAITDLEGNGGEFSEVWSFTILIDVESSISQIDYVDSDLTAYISLADQLGIPITDLQTSNFTVEESLDGNTWTEVSVETVKTVEASNLPIIAALTMDYSGSMSPIDITNVEDATKDFINNIKVNDSIEIIKFGSDVYTYPGSGFSSDKTTLLDAVDNGIADNGATSLYDAVYQGLEDINYSGFDGIRVVLAFTDGYDNDSVKTKDDCINYSIDNSIGIYSIGFGSADTIGLEELATSGIYKYATDSSALTTLYSEISNRINETYLLKWSTAGTSGETLYIRVTMEYDSDNGEIVEITEKTITLK